ncbi:hypothetical protein AB4391_01465 [Vibrio lentus]|uniref:Uncharacterized protein n=1 Tax=Vibrio lentus TaxID=136468 RepID=A0A2N7KP64_9VIBR|nr:hypothetical protein [Vibrio lentus]PMM78438.1 hypothetical protein BCT49_00040 [Vibrio lentus]
MTTAKKELTLLEHHNQLTDAIARDESISADIKSLLVCISTFFNTQKQCAFPSRKKIAARMGCCVNYVTELIAKAKKTGRIKVTAQFTKTAIDSAPRQVANKYEFALEMFGLYYKKAKTLFNRHLRKKNKKKEATQQASAARVDYITQQLDEASVSEQPDIDTYEWEEYEPPK